MPKLISEMTDAEIIRLVSDNAATMIYNNPLMGIMYQYIPLRPVKNLPTIGVIVAKTEHQELRPRFYIGYNIDFIRKNCFIGTRNGAFVNTLEGLLCHEVAHILLNHPQRRTGLDKARSAIAIDIVINDHLIGRLPDNGCYSSTFNLAPGHNMEWYYNNLPSNINDSNPDSPGSLDDHGQWGELSDSELQELAETAQTIAREGIAKSKSHGHGSGGLMELIEARWKPQINWKNLLRFEIGKHKSTTKYKTFKRPDRKEQALFLDRDNPGLRMFKGTAKDHKLKPLVALDTSGSVSSEEISKIYSELIPLANQFAFDICQFDHSLTLAPTEFRKGSALAVHGRGGTCFDIPVQTAVEGGYDVLIVCTDGECNYPPQPEGVHVIWCMTRDYTAPWGTTIRIT